MKKLAIVFLSATLLTSSAFAAGKVVATYSGSEVTSDQIMSQYKAILDLQPNSKGKAFAELDRNMQEALVRNYINQKLFAKEANKLGIRNSAEFKEKMKSAESQILQQELLERHLKTAVTDKMVEEEYNKWVISQKGQKEIKVSHILVDTEERAKEIKIKLNKGGKFESLVKEYSKDEMSKASGGEIGYVVKGMLVPEFESKAFAMKKNEISDPVQTQFGWHIIKVSDSRDVKLPSKEQGMNGIRGKLSREAVDKYVAQLSTQANVQLKLD